MTETDPHLPYGKPAEFIVLAMGEFDRDRPCPRCDGAARYDYHSGWSCEARAGPHMHRFCSRCRTDWVERLVQQDTTGVPLSDSNDGEPRSAGDRPGRTVQLGAPPKTGDAVAAHYRGSTP